MEIVRDVKILRPYLLELVFSDGSRREIDLEKELYGEIFEPLKDPSFFSQARVDKDLGTVVWPNGADFSPEFLHNRARNLKDG